MRALAIALEDGFDDDHVIVRVDSQVVLDTEHVSTRYQIGLAKMFEVPVNPDEVRVEVRLPDRGMVGETKMNVAHSPNLRVSVESGEVAFNASDAPLFYA